jgi:hypothetical protein
MKLLLIFLLSFNVYAQKSASTIKGKIQAPKSYSKKSNFKVNLDHFFFDFQGHRAEKNNIYNFEKVTTEIYMATLTYAIDPLTNLSVSVNQRTYIANTVFYGFLFKDETKGTGDTEVRLNRSYLYRAGILVPEIGISLPTADISRKNENAQEFNYPYNMQLGTGTYDPFASLTFVKPMGAHQLGAMGKAKVRIGKNENEYRKGNEYNLKAWYSYAVNPYISPGIWINAEERKAIRGADKTFGRIPTTEYYHHDRRFFDATSYVNLQYPIVPRLKLKGLVAVPLWQDQINYDNLELHTDWFTQVGIEGTF